MPVDRLQSPCKACEMRQYRIAKALGTRTIPHVLSTCVYGSVSAAGETNRNSDLPMQTPFPRQAETPADHLVDEIRLSFTTGIICGIVGGLGWLYHWLQGTETHLAALLVVASFYLVMGISKSLYRQWGPRQPQSLQPGH